MPAHKAVAQLMLRVAIVHRLQRTQFQRTKSRSLIAAVACVFAGTFSVATAHADDDTARARSLFDEAGELERQGQWAAAQEKLRSALRIRETPHLRYALAWALENDDRLIEARTEYETALRLAQKANAEEVARLTTARLAELDKKTPVVRVLVPHALAGSTQIIIDGRAAPLRDDSASIPVNPGSRVVRIERAGRPPTEQLIYVSRGELRIIDVEDDAAVASRTGAHERHTIASTATSGRVREHQQHDRAVLPYVLIGAGAAAVVGGGALLVSSASDASARDEKQRAWCDATACTNGTTATRPETAEAEAFRREAVDASDRGNTKQILGVSFGLAGLISAGIGTWMLVRDPGDHRGKDSVQKVRLSFSPSFASAAVQF